MTAEIAVMNKQAIALAADSAVTIGMRQKTYNSANKLFMLSKYEPVGAMIYGGAEFLGIPWETILKCYREELGERSFDHLEEYAEDVFRFIRTNEDLFSKERKESHLASVFQSLFLDVLQKLNDAVGKKLAHSGDMPPITDDKVVELFSQTINRYKSELQKSSSLEEGSWPQIEDQVRQVGQQAITRVFEDLPITATNTADLLWLAREWLNRDVWGSSHSGLVIAGFGKKDIYPALQDFKVELVIGNYLKRKCAREQAISDNNDACIIPFAQGEMVQAFMEGADPRYKRMAEGQLDTLFSGIPRKLVDNLLDSGRIKGVEQAEVLKCLKNDIGKLLISFKDSLQNFQNANFVQETLRIVNALPKGELGEMAEALVSLTSFRRRMSLDAETVGGPIDVAVISKGDGFIWVNRKHYFKPDLNHGFFQNYYRSGD